MHVAGDGLAHDGQHRHQPFLAALAFDAQHVAIGRRRVLRLDAERLGDAQAGAVEQQQHGGIAREDPVELGAGPGIDDAGRLADGQRLRHRMRHLRHGELQDGAVLDELLRFEPAEQLAQRRKGAGQRAADGAGAAARGEKAAEGLEVETGEVGEAGRVAELRCDEAEELADVARVGFERLLRVAALVTQVRQPGGDGALQVGAQRQLKFGGFVGHRSEASQFDAASR